MKYQNQTGWLWSSGKETKLRRQHVSGSIHLLRETKSQLSWSPNTDMSLCFRAHLNTRRDDISVGCTSPWGLVWASPWVYPRLNKKKKNIYNIYQNQNINTLAKFSPTSYMYLTHFCFKQCLMFPFSETSLAMYVYLIDFAYICYVISGHSYSQPNKKWIIDGVLKVWLLL